MKTLKVTGIVISSILLLALSAFFITGLLKPKLGGVFINSDPVASVYIEGQLVGKTPYKGTFDPGQITVKLVPDNLETNLLPYETRIKIISGIETVIRREFGATEGDSSGDVITFEKDSGTASLVVISTPDNAQVSIDGVPRGFAPYKTGTISPAEHQITVKANGFTDRIMTVRTIDGYRLTLFAKLSKEKAEDLKMEAPVEEVTFVEILDTPTGFLRVRTAPGTAGQEIAEVKPGEKYLFLATDEATGWHKIQYSKPQAGLPDGIVGWVSNQYSKKVTSDGKEATESATLAN